MFAAWHLHPSSVRIASELVCAKLLWPVLFINTVQDTPGAKIPLAADEFFVQYLVFPLFAAAMADDDTESYKYQLEQVELALANDPNNEELKKLQQDLKELIALTSQLEEQQQSSHKKKTPTPTATPTPPTQSSDTTPTGTGTTAAAAALKTNQFSVGQDVMARWSGDGQFYRATITAIGGADQVFSVKFRGYQETEVVKAEDVRPLETKKRQGIFEDVAVPKKQKKKKEPGQKKVSEVEVKKNAWLNFASSAESKKKNKRMAATPINKKSIFKTPDNPEGKGTKQTKKRRN